MTRGKRLLSVFLSLVLCFMSFFSLFSTSALAADDDCGATGSSVKFSYDSGTKTLTITGTGAIKDYSDVDSIFSSGHAPWEDYREECEYVIIGEGVTRIGDYSFILMTALKSVTLPSTLKEIGENAFSDCAALQDCKLPNNLQIIERYAFQNCTSLEDVDFPEGLTTIGPYAYTASGITSVDLPDSLTNLGEKSGFLDPLEGFVFANCPNLESVKFGSGLTSTGMSTFYMSGVRYVDFGSTITEISEYSFFETDITTIEIPENITSIGMRAFANTQHLTHVYIYNSECAFGTRVAPDPFDGSQQSVTLHGHSQSTTQTFAEENAYAFVSIDNCAHSNMYEDITLEPTCTEPGSKDIICSDCGITVRTETIDALGHDFVTDSTEDKTAEDGHIYEYQTCSRCGEKNTVYTHQDWVEGYYTDDYTIAPTCTRGGTAVRRCTICTQVNYAVVIPALGHNIENYTQQTPPTCTEEGHETGVCTNCGETVTVTLPATGHTEELVSTRTTEDGHTYNEYHCSVCGNDRPECIHNEWIEGYYTESVVSEPSCTYMGSSEKKCTICGKTETTNIMPTGHVRDEGVVTKEPTCTENGETTRTCINCGDKMVLPFPLALGHDDSVESVLQEPTCTQSGTGKRECSRCGELLATYEIPALGHNISDAADYNVIEEPSCIEPGKAAGTCANCAEYVEVDIPAGGHVFDSENAVITKEPTCEEEGTAAETCTVCGAQQETSIPATGHNYRYSHHYVGTVGTYLAYFCTTCGAEHDELKTSVQLGFRLYYNDKRADVTDGYLYDVNYDGYINSRDHMIIEEYVKLK